ncbi:hypothetical protein PENANT_c031G00628 [Penicillium antarcticum]|uniref:Uncharacterized protein n=1 Tax=Penicillium antarcticum TaxID=416450 RepID=A0A1V6PVS9_9EURO|nr:hypothetical protein PENANT_c031G00628 [Penicillium antarcticum]
MKVRLLTLQTGTNQIRRHSTTIDERKDHGSLPSRRPYCWPPAAPE